MVSTNLSAPSAGALRRSAEAPLSAGRRCAVQARLRGSRGRKKTKKNGRNAHFTALAASAFPRLRRRLRRQGDGRVLRFRPEARNGRAVKMRRFGQEAPAKPTCGLLTVRPTHCALRRLREGRRRPQAPSKPSGPKNGQILGDRAAPCNREGALFPAQRQRRPPRLA